MVFCAIIDLNAGKGSGLLLTADFFWNIFEATGSITAYLIYRKLIASKIYFIQ